MNVDLSIAEKRAQWPIGLALLFIHLGALAAFIPGTFTWSGVAVFAVLWFLTGAIGVSLGYHRLLTHRSLKVPKWLEYAIAFVGTLSLQGGPIEWVSTHRIHHAHTDKEGDPHNAHDGLIWTHLEWLYRPNEYRPTNEERRRYAPDLWKDPVYRFLDKYAPVFQIALGIGVFLVGGWSWLIWGIFVRLVIVYHITWLVNSAAHRFGYQTYATGDQSTNCWWVALVTWGEGWHNNHHAFPSSARHGLARYEFDPTWLMIRTLGILGLARDVKLPTDGMKMRMLAQRESVKLRAS